jgi:AcrR family transcriptional regulator
MKDLLSVVRIQVPEQIYLKDPESSDLGKRIIKGSIDLLDKIGFEQFTFRKLSRSIDSTEASVYRYFESKHKLLLYLLNWYWSWMEYRLVFGLANIESPKDRLKRAVGILTAPIEEDLDFIHIDETKLYNIVISESSKAYLTRDVDEENKVGMFKGYKKLVARVSKIILEINPRYKYPNILVSTVVEGTKKQRFFADHLPGLTNTMRGEDTITSFYTDLVLKEIQ